MIKKFNTKVKEKLSNFFDWIKGAELVELNSCDVKEDPVRPELDNNFRTEYGRKIYGVKYRDEICAIMCFGFTNDIPKTVEELDLMTKDAHLQSLITLSPLTEMARNFHLRNGAFELQVNEKTQNFEYKI